MPFKKPTGTVDFYPEEMETRNKIFASLRNTANKFGFREIESPAFENIDLLTKKSGEEVTKQIFTLEKKGDESFGLRFDLTVPFTRMFMEKQKEISKPVKWFGLSRMWRYERPQQGRLREFYQLSVELFGSDKPEADAEIINLAVSCLRELGLTSEDFYARVNNRKLLQGIIEMFFEKENAEKVTSLVDKKDKITEEEFENGLEEFGCKDKERFMQIIGIDDIKELEKLKLNSLAREGKEDLERIFPLLQKKFVRLDLSVARGLAYYTGTVFELFDKKGRFRALAGGGRYDNMVELFGGESCPATGFGIGYSTLSLLLKERGIMPEPKTSVDIYVVVVNPNLMDKAMPIIQKLRKKYSVDYDLMQRSTKKQMNQADRLNAKKVIFIGEKELWTKKLTVKDMESGDEEEMEISGI